MDELALLKPKLARLKLSGMLDTLSERLSQALAEQWSYTQFLDMLLTDEAERRDFKQLGRRLTKSGLAPDKTLETFDFSFNPRIHAPTLRELATCRFVERAENVFFVGPSGVGKATQLRRSGTSPVARDMRSPTSAPACCSTGSTPVAATAPTSAGCAGSAPSLFLSWTISVSPLCPARWRMAAKRPQGRRSRRWPLRHRSRHPACTLTADCLAHQPKRRAGASADGSAAGAGRPVSPLVSPAPEPAPCVTPDGGPSGVSTRAAAHTARDSVHSRHQSPPRRHIPAAVRRHVWLRDGGRCCYRDPLTGRRCTSSHLLQIDHLLPVAQGGGPDLLHLRCFAHRSLRHGHGSAVPPERPM